VRPSSRASAAASPRAPPRLRSAQWPARAPAPWQPSSRAWQPKRRAPAHAARPCVRCAHAARGAPPPLPSLGPRVRSQRALFFFSKTVLRIPLAHDASKTALLAHLVQFSRPRRFSSPRSRPPPRRHSCVSPGAPPSSPCAPTAQRLAVLPPRRVAEVSSPSLPLSPFSPALCRRRSSAA
jgi:hypothetical protein